jgi:uncharacterized repeat protein (TIGR01451 family)
MENCDSSKSNSSIQYYPNVKPCCCMPCCNECQRPCNPCNPCNCCPPPPCPLPNPCCNPQQSLCCPPVPCCYAKKDLKVYPFLSNKKCVIRVGLEKSANVTSFLTIGQLITYTYKLTNLGNVCVNFPVLIVDDKLGCFTVCPCMPPCGGTQEFLRSYVVQASDIYNKKITNKAYGFVQLCDTKWVCTNTSEVSICYGSANVSGIITQTQESSVNTVNVVVQLSNAAGSGTEAKDVSLVLAFPLNVSGVTGLSADSPATTPTLNGNAVVIKEASLPVGATYTYRFTYTANVVPGSYQWSGYIQTGTCNINTNTFITDTFLVNNTP